MAGIGCTVLVVLPFIIATFIGMNIAQQSKLEIENLSLDATSTPAILQNVPLIAVNETCNESLGHLCEPTLFCKKNSPNICMEKTTMSPHIVSANFSGLQPDTAGYRASSKSPIAIEARTENIAHVRILQIASGATEAITVLEMKKMKEGRFSTTIRLSLGFVGDVIILGEGKDGSTNSLRKHIASVE